MRKPRPRLREARGFHHDAPLLERRRLGAAGFDHAGRDRPQLQRTYQFKGPAHNDQPNNLNPGASQLRPTVISNACPVPGESNSERQCVQYLVPASAANFPLGPVVFTGSGSTRTLVLPAGIGTFARNTVRTPGELDLDLAVGRKFSINDRMRIALRAEAFNLLNHTNFQPPDVALTVAADPTDHNRAGGQVHSIGWRFEFQRRRPRRPPWTLMRKSVTLAWPEEQDACHIKRGSIAGRS